MSRKKLKGFDPGNNNKAARDHYAKLQEGSTLRDLAPKAQADSNRLSGAARRFAMQLLVSQKLDERDRAKARGEGVSGKKFQPDYKVKLAEQIAAKAAAQKKVQAKAERRKAGTTTPGAPNQTTTSTSSSNTQSSTTPPTLIPSSNGVVSLSKSVDQQRQAKNDRKNHAKSQAEINAEKAAAAKAEAEAAAAAATTPDTESGPTVAPKITFTTEMRPGESFRSYQARLVLEKSRMMNAEVVQTAKGLSAKKKRKLDEKEQRKKEKKDMNLDPMERKVRAEREAKDALDAQRGEKRLREEDSSSTANKRPKREVPTDFQTTETVEFGEVADRPPTLTVVPKSKTLKGIDSDRIIDSLLLMQPPKKKGGKKMDELEKAEWIEKQRDLSRRVQLAAEEKERNLATLREQSVAAYKASKKRRRETEADEKATEEKPYVKKSVLKKQKRNRERMRAFKDTADMELDMEIEMADQFD